MEFIGAIELKEEQIKEILKKFFNAERVAIFYHEADETGARVSAIVETKIEMEI